MGAKKINTTTHVVDILGSTIGRDQPVMTMEKALEFLEMLDSKILEKDSHVYLNPFTKAGEILLATAITKIFKHSEKKLHLLTNKKIEKEIFSSNNYYAIAPDERHYRLCQRTFLGNEKSHISKYGQNFTNGDYVSEKDGTVNKEKFLQELNKMINHIKKTSKDKKIIAIGNPPYQESDGGHGKSAKSIYNFFTEALIEHEDIDEFVLVIPARWFAGGKGLDSFRKRMKDSRHIKNLVYFQYSSEVFPTVDINGGVCYLHYDKKYSGKTNFSDGLYTKSLSLDKYDIIADDPNGYSIINKVLTKWEGEYVSKNAWARKAYGIATNYFDKNKSISKNLKCAIPCFNKDNDIKYINKKDVTKNLDSLNLWKVAVPKAAGGSKGKRRSTIPENRIFIIGKGYITTETYNIVHTFKTKGEAEKFVKYLQTDFARYMLGLRKITQDLPADRWSWVPAVDTSKNWNDKKLMDFFGLTKKEREHIKNKIQEWS